MELNNINEVIEAYKTDKIDTETVLHILEAQPTAIAIWVDSEGYSYSKAETLTGLRNYKKYIESGCEVPLFFPFLSDETPDVFSFNGTLSNGKPL